MLRAHEAELRARGVLHAAVFGSVARGDADVSSDLDIMVELDREARLSLFDYAGIQLYLQDLFQTTTDLVERSTLKEYVRDEVLQEAVDAF